MNDHQIIRSLVARIRELEEEIENIHWMYGRQIDRLTRRGSAEAYSQASYAWEEEESAHEGDER